MDRCELPCPVQSLLLNLFFETGSHVDSFAPAYHVAENDLELLIFLLLLLVLSAGIIGKGYHACLLH